MKNKIIGPTLEFKSLDTSMLSFIKAVLVL